MGNKIEKSDRFALLSSFYLTALLTSFLWIVLTFTVQTTYGHIILLFACFCFIAVFLVLKKSVDNFMYRHVKKIYDKFELTKSTKTKDTLVTTDMNTLIAEVEKYSKERKSELENLKGQEAYRKEYLGNVSHELKTPLFTVQSYILTLLDGAKDTPEILEKYLERANKGVERLLYIVKDLDMITKLETDGLNMELTNFNIVELVQSVFDMFEVKARKKNIALTFDMNYKDPILVNGDMERIQQVLSNLIMNSIKYGKQDGTTEISIENLVKTKVIVRVTDNGEGIKKHHIERLFERFYRVDKSGSRKEGGSGLGLSIVKHIVEAHNERIYVESTYGMGSEFSFTLQKFNPTKTREA